MAYFKLISGNIAADSKLTSMFNAYSLYHSTGIFSTEDYKIMENLVTLTQITEENKASFIGKAGWGLAGGLVLGPVGLLAGLLAGGNKKTVCCAFEMLPNYRFVAEIEAKAYAALSEMAYNNRQAGKFFPNPDLDHTNDITVPKEDIQTRLQKLTSLKEQGLITDEEYNTQRQRILQDL